MPGYATPAVGYSEAGKKKPTPTDTAFSAYGDTARKQSNDYTDIMDRYKNLYSSIPGAGAGGGSGNSTFNYTVPTYQTTPDYQKSSANLRTASDRGLYSDEDQANLRERGISPIRSTYANAQRNVNRQRSLQGGYSPNYAAVSAKMAREMSSQLSDATTRVNAQIAQDVASQKANAQGQYASNSLAEQGNRNQFALNAADMGNKYGLDKINTSMQEFWNPVNAKLSTLSGMNSTFGTSPGFTTTMQNGAINTGNLANNTAQIGLNNDARLKQIYGGR